MFITILIQWLKNKSATNICDALLKIFYDTDFLIQIFD